MARYVTAVATALLGAGLLAVDGSAIAQGLPSGAPAVPASVAAQAAAGRSVRVIVGVRAQFSPEGQLNARDAATQRERIARTLREVIARLPGNAAPRARAFETIPFFAAELDPAALLQLQQDPDILSIEEDVAVPPTLATSAPLIGASTAWNTGYTGSGWNVAILDTGVDKTHPFFAGKIVSEACYSNIGGTGSQVSLCPDGTGSSTATGSGVNCSPTVSGSCGHGTHVAGIAAGSGGASFYGIARNAGVIAIQVFTSFPTGCGGGPCVLSYSSDQIRGMERVYALRTTYNIAAVNMSLGGGRYYDQATCDTYNGSVKAAIDNLRSVGIATVISAGNNAYRDSVTAPGCISSAVSVGATTKFDGIAGFSNVASFLSLLAPGESIYSSVPGGFSWGSGTSMAAPHVTGAWALMKQRKPTASVTEILNAFRSTGVQIVDSRSGASGASFPRIQVDRAIGAMSGIVMSLDSPVNGSTHTGAFAVTGWAIDQAASSGSGVDAVHVYAYPSTGGSTFLGAASYGAGRADVGALYGSRFTNSGFGLTTPALPNGTYLVIAYARSTVTGGFDISQSATVTVAAPVSTPLAAIDTPHGTTVGSSFFISGWAIDRGATSSTGVDAVHVYALPSSGPHVFLGVATQGIARPDVGAVYGSQFNASGYQLVAGGLPPGPYTLVVYYRSTITGIFSSRITGFTVEIGDPAMSLDTPSNGSTLSRPFVVAGWAVDRDAPTGTGVDTLHAWAYPVGGGAPVFLGTPAYGGARDDVGAVFGARFTNSAFNLLVTSLSPGAYDLVVYAHSTVTSTFNQARNARIVVN